ncbi:MAG: hypothetical protein IPK24_22195 [Kineosporiaceae bacterium]|nr:hypothetical protein [Kineosporiaceae bacterium]
MDAEAASGSAWWVGAWSTSRRGGWPERAAGSVTEVPVLVGAAGLRERAVLGLALGRVPGEDRVAVPMGAAREQVVPAAVAASHPRADDLAWGHRGVHRRQLGRDPVLRVRVRRVRRRCCGVRRLCSSRGRGRG